jgi:phytanoyl-CoA hydroxylase
MAASPKFDHLENEPYDPSLYAVDGSIVPIAGWAGVDDAMLEQYRQLGFVSVTDAFPEDLLTAVGNDLQKYIERGAPDGMELQFERAAMDVLDTLPREEWADYVRKFMWFVKFEESFQLMAHHPELLAVVESLLGGEAEMFQEMALFKPPCIGREKPWHQDHAYFNLPEGTPVVGVWIALDEATLENGCMVFRPGGHRDGPIPHFNRRDWQICDTEFLGRTGAVATPIPRGGCLIFDGLTPHGTPANRSDKRRRAVQFHYVLKGTPRVETEERMRIFGSEGRDVSC